MSEEEHERRIIETMRIPPVILGEWCAPNFIQALWLRGILSNENVRCLCAPEEGCTDESD
jgi:hypothetical protein